MMRRIELILNIEAGQVKVLHCREMMVPGAPDAASAAAATPDPQSKITEEPSAPLPRGRQAISPQLGRQIQDEIARDNQRIGIHLIGRISQGMMTDPTGVLGRARAEQIFGMLELAEILDLGREMSQFLEHHHAAILHGLR